MDTPDERRSQPRALTTTSYAVLSILSLRDHSTYDLIRQMRLSLHFLWPRAESNVYAEPPRLVEAGLATMRVEWTGRRKRTVYGISDAGRQALAQWLAAPSSPDRFESEALLKVLFAENGTRDALLAAIDALAEDAKRVIDHFVRLADRYAASEGEYPRRFALTALAARLLLQQSETTLRWAEWGRDVARSWTTPLSGSPEWGVEAVRSIATPDPAERATPSRRRRPDYSE
jgi:DNA-binding PadR family transcriptional regulator